jgi:hypothetical protein
MKFPGLTSSLLLATLVSMIYPGGKEMAAPRIINLMPPHDVYLEPFLGGGAVLRAKKPARLSIGVDRCTGRRWLTGARRAIAL